jgi:hypothetical protein
MGYAWHLPRIPPGSFPRDHEAIRRLAAALVERLAPALPPGFSLASDHGRLLVLHGHEVLHSIDMEWALEGDDSTLEGCMWGVLDGVQDVIAEETADPWPNTRPRLPTAAAQVRAGALHLRYEDDEGVVLELEPIRFRDC